MRSGVKEKEGRGWTGVLHLAAFHFQLFLCLRPAPAFSDGSGLFVEVRGSERKFDEKCRASSRGSSLLSLRIIVSKTGLSMYIFAIDFPTAYCESGS